MCKCLITGEELPDEANVKSVGYECRAAGRYSCPNFMHNFSHGKNCRLLQDNSMHFARFTLDSTKEPYRELYKNKSKAELKEKYQELYAKYMDCFEAESRVLLRAQLGAIEELLKERDRGA